MIQFKDLKKITFLLLLNLCCYSAIFAQNVTLSGYVYDDATGESLVGVTVQARAASKGTTTNNYGFYSFSLPAGTQVLTFSYLGFEPTEKTIELKTSQNLNIRLGEKNNVIKDVVISAQANHAQEMVKNTEMSKISIPIEILKRTPVLFGESDLIKAVQLLPGVKRGGEGSVGMYVRGGGNDENLILLDEAPVYNIGHVLGFLSVFNTNSIKSVDIYKGAFPSQYGGRLSSILDIRMREGNDQRFSTQGSIGNIASNLTVEAPIVKGRGSFILSGRRSYLDKLIKWTTKFELPYYFYDMNAKANYKITDRDRVYVSSYFGNDVITTPEINDTTNFDAGISSKLGNFTVTSRWNHIYKNNKIFHNLTVLSSRFRYKVEAKVLDNEFLISSSINDLGAKMDYTYLPDTKTTIRFGTALTNHIFRPNLISAQGGISELIKNRPAKKISNQELAFYGSIDRDFGEDWKLNGGLRLSGSAVQGVFYKAAEPRFSARYALNDKHSLKIGYARMNQYLHLVSSSSLALPTDLWYPVTKSIKPSSSDQVSFGYFTYFGTKSKVEFSVETYYKKMNRLLEYRPGAQLLLNDNYEKELITGSGDAYGFELLAQKNAGKLTGWVGYTLSWANRKFDAIDNGKEYYSRYDRRHDVSVVLNYDFVRRFGVSLAWVYSSGSPFTPVVAKYLQPYPSYNGVELLPVYPTKNSYRLNGARRLDIDFVFRGKKRPRWQGEWHLGAYNAGNRAQPNRVVLTLDPTTGREKYQERGLFGIIGSLSYNFKF
jgi:CarboxypepD_reg-like domain/TonB-dependent Receptor Plug Domain